MENREEFYLKLKKKLEENSIFPSKYLFKFIVSTSDGKVAKVEDLFKNEGAVISKNLSKTGKFTSVSIKILINSSNEVIEKYKKAEKIDGIISL